METRRYLATNLREVLDGQERTIAWLTRRCNAAECPVSYSLMNYIVHRQRTASHKVASTVAEILRVPLFLIFETTDVVLETAEQMREAVPA